MPSTDPTTVPLDLPPATMPHPSHDPARAGAHLGARDEVALVDEGWPLTLYVAFGLVREGLRVHLLSTDRVARRWLPPEIRATTLPKLDDPRFDAALDAALASDPPPIVVRPMTEPLQARLADLAGGAPWHARIWPRHDARQQPLLRDKRAMSDFVRDIGEPVPRQRDLHDARDLDAAIAELGLPIVIKGPSGRGGSDVCIARTAAEASAARRQIDERVDAALSGDGAAAFAQEYLDGPTYMVGGLFDAGTAIRVWTARKVEMFPALTGPSTIVRTVAEPELQRSALAIFAALRLDGLASADFIRGPDGTFRFLEVNPRPWGAIGAARPGGVDFFGPLADLLRGREPHASTPAPRDGRPVALFPQLLEARLATGGTRALLAALRDPAVRRGIPWHAPRLLAACLHRLWWTWDRLRRERRPSPASAPQRARSSAAALVALQSVAEAVTALATSGSPQQLQ